MEEIFRLVFCLFATLEHGPADVYVIKILGMNILQTTARSTATSNQSFPLGLIAFLKNTDNRVYRVLNILWSVLCIKIQLCDLSNENYVLCCTSDVCFCFCALKTVKSHDAGRELNMNVTVTCFFFF